MAASEEPNAAASLHGSSSASQPLLSNPSPPPLLYPYPTIDDPPQSNPSESDPSQYLQISYNYGHRPFKDIPILVLFILFVLSSFGFGIFATFNRNINYSNLSSYYYDEKTSNCVTDSVFSSSPILVFLYSFSSSSSVLKSLIWTLVATLILSLPICFFLLLLLKHYTRQIVYASLPFFVLVPIFINVYWFIACTVNPTCSYNFPMVYRILVLIFMFLVIGVIVWIFIVNWHRIGLTISIIGVASDALSMNLGLLVVIPSMTLGLLIYYAPIVLFLVFARLNGKIVPHHHGSSGDYTCVWKQDKWVPAYYALAILTMLWSGAVMVEGQVYVISGTISQWYFSKEEDDTPRRSIRKSLRNAFGPSAGTVCLSGLLILVVRVVRAMVDSARQEDTPGVFKIILRCCVNTFLAAVDYLNKFTITFAAITGEAYCSSARMTYELLKRNLLSTVFVETISTRLLLGIAFVLSTIYAIVACAILRAVSHLGADTYLVAFAAWLLLIVILEFFIHVLDNVIETVYVCYAIDRDRGEVCKQDVHEVYVHLPISRNHRSSLVTTSLLV
ncbi:CTL-like protein DDB_G0288717 [Cucurbita moschata]|uniref:Choline transporter-like protein n=1 Tax=Cucurbita moschata TaxID=3662 RepID=A0A6J1G6Z1_CUCMO|nr:CTL-like protein DDB_G0288717 [Cucurbita moschata]